MATHRAFRAIAFGIDTLEVEHVLGISIFSQVKSQNFLIQVDGILDPNIASKNSVLRICSIIVTAGGTDCTIEFMGSAIRKLSIEA